MIQPFLKKIGQISLPRLTGTCFRQRRSIKIRPSCVKRKGIKALPIKSNRRSSMGKEIERKFLVTGDGWRSLAKGTAYRQGYLNSARERTVRIRTIEDRAFLTIKGLTVGVTRAEYEYEIPLSDGDAMLDALAEKPVIEKKRYKVSLEGLAWEIDEFFGDNAGLIVAEVELKSEGHIFRKPEWVGEEVTADPRYFNSNLIKHPFSKW
jgi:adenylate cyclase